MVILTKSIEARDRLHKTYQDWLRNAFPGTDAFVHPMDIGPPVGRPVQYRVSGPDIGKVRDYAQALGNIVAKNRHLGDLTFDWMEPARMVRVNVLQDKARTLGVSSQDIASTINSVVNGATVTQVRDDIYLVDVIARARDNERGSVETLQNLQLPAANGQSVPLAAVANFSYGLEQPTIWRRSRLPTITIKVAVAGAVQPATVVTRAGAAGEDFRRGPAARIQGRGRRRGRGKRQGAGPDQRGHAADAVRHGDDPDDPVAELQPAVPGLRGGAAGAHRRGRGAAAEPFADGLRRHRSASWR